MPGHYSFTKTFAINRTKESREKLELGLISGVIHNVIIDFPAGCQYLTHVKITRGVTSIWPRNQGSFYAFENYRLPINDFWVLDPGEKELVLEGYNEDTVFEHTIRLAFQVSTKEVYFAQMGLLSRMDELIDKQSAIIGDFE